ncbi:MAG: hypothetical protein IH946_12680, partial [Bacteroidetes bacterium]|nr:hypothetical protein [Bacteroidota bacterium]
MKKLATHFTLAIACTLFFACGGSDPQGETDTENTEETTEETTGDTSMDKEETSIDDFMDPIEVASDNYRLLAEEGNVRMVEMTLEPGQRDNEHSHKNETAYFITGGKAKIYVGDDVMEMDIPDGHVMNHEAWTHSIENVGETTIHAIIFEQMEMEFFCHP